MTSLEAVTVLRALLEETIAYRPALVLKLPRRLESPNFWNGRHWRVKHRISQEWQLWIFVGAAKMCGRYRRGAGPRKMRVTVERHVPSKRNFIRDDDNLRFAVKPLMDALKRGGYIYDDARKWLDHPTPTQHVSVDGKDYTVITIQAVR